MKSKLLFTTAILLGAFSIHAQTTFWDETTDGDLSDDNTAPNGPFTMVQGENILNASQQGNPSDVDYLTITIPDGFILEALVLEEYDVADTSNQAFLGVQQGSSFTTDAMSTTASDLLGGITYGTDNIDLNLLANMGILDGATGFTGGLEAGTYTFWLNQTGDNSTVMLSFDVEMIEPDGIFVWEDDFDGDSSDDHTDPTGVFTLKEGGNYIYTIQDGNSSDVDYITFTVPNGLELTEILVDDYLVTDASNQAFLGIQQGSSFTTDAASTTAADLLGGITYGNSEIGSNILPTMGSLSGATGFSGPLEADTYTLWFNQTGEVSEVGIVLTLNQTLSVDDNQLSESTVQLYPNPASDIFNLNSESPIQTVRIIDASGRLVQNQKIENNLSVQLNVSSLKSGLYLVQVQTTNGLATKRFLKQ